MKQHQINKLEDIINKDYKNITGIVVMKNDKILYENYFNGCDRNSHIHVYSVTKSIVSILVGIAIDKGYIKSIEQNISDFYTVNLRNQNITLKNLLTMTTPYRYIIPPYKKYFTSDDWVKFSLDSLSHKKPGKFKYAPLTKQPRIPPPL